MLRAQMRGAARGPVERKMTGRAASLAITRGTTPLPRAPARVRARARQALSPAARRNGKTILRRLIRRIRPLRRASRSREAVPAPHVGGASQARRTRGVDAGG